MIQVSNIERRFVMKKDGKDIILKEVDPTWSVDEIMTFYSHVHPELVNATYNEKGIEDDVIIYEFTTTIGTKG